jgi:hypothetical protein
MRVGRACDGGVRAGSKKEWEAESDGMPGAQRKTRASFKRRAMFTVTGQYMLASVAAWKACSRAAAEGRKLLLLLLPSASRAGPWETRTSELVKVDDHMTRRHHH